MTKPHLEDYDSFIEYEQALHDWMNDDSYIGTDTVIPYEKYLKGMRNHFE